MSKNKRNNQIEHSPHDIAYRASSAPTSDFQLMRHSTSKKHHFEQLLFNETMQPADYPPNNHRESSPLFIPHLNNHRALTLFTLLTLPTLLSAVTIQNPPTFTVSENMKDLSQVDFKAALQTAEGQTRLTVSASNIDTLNIQTHYHPSAGSTQPPYDTTIIGKDLADLSHHKQVKTDGFTIESTLKANTAVSFSQQHANLVLETEDTTSHTPSNLLDQKTELYDLNNVTLAESHQMLDNSVDNTFNATHIGFFSLRERQGLTPQSNKTKEAEVETTQAHQEAPTPIPLEDDDLNNNQAHATPDTSTKLVSKTGLLIFNESPEGFVNLSTLRQNAENNYREAKSTRGGDYNKGAKFNKLGHPMDEYGHRYMPVKPKSHARSREAHHLQRYQNKNAYQERTDQRASMFSHIDGESGYARALVHMLFEGDVSKINEQLGTHNGALAIITIKHPQTYEEKLQQPQGLTDLRSPKLPVLTIRLLDLIQEELEQKKTAILDGAYTHDHLSEEALLNLNTVMHNTIDEVQQGLNKWTLERYKDMPDIKLNEAMLQAYPKHRDDAYQSPTPTAGC